MRKILPMNDPDGLGITYLHRTKVRSQLIYSIILGVILAALVALPFIYVDVSVKSTGLLQSSVEKSELIIPVNGKISHWNVADNGRINKGDTLFRIDATQGNAQQGLIRNRIRELEQMNADIKTLSSIPLSGMRTANPVLKSPQYRAAFQQLRQQLQNAAINRDQEARSFLRYQKLYRSKAISLAEYEKYRSASQQAQSDYAFVSKQYSAQWQSESSDYRAELNELYRMQSDWNIQETFYTYKAPVSGTVHNLAGLQAGSLVFANQKIADFSPDTSLLAVAYVSPSDIGLLRKGQKVQFLVDAFNYNQWGVLKGEVIEIAEDIVAVGPEQQPVFRVKCKTATGHMKLDNGYTGRLKKGMTFQARFMITRRSVFQLLHDKVDDWLNPSVLRTT